MMWRSGRSSRLCLKVIKSNSMLIGSRQRISNKTLNVSVGCKLSSFVCYLGVTIDPSLSWNLHISNVMSRARSRVASFLHFGSLSPMILCALYYAFVLPVYDYCDVVWSPTTVKFTGMLEIVYSKFIKRLPSSCASRLSFTLTERQRYHTAIQIFRSVHNYSPSYLSNIFHYSKDVTGYCGRNVNRFFVPTVFTNFGKRSFYYHGTVCH